VWEITPGTVGSVEDSGASTEEETETLDRENVIYETRIVVVSVVAVVGQ
jgi:hypothetical protein